MFRIFCLLLSIILLTGCAEKTFKGMSNKTEVKKEEKKPIIKFSNPFTDDVDIEDILGR